MALGVVAISILPLVACGSRGNGGSLTASYQFGPVEFAIDSSGRVSVSLNERLVTPLGTFSVGIAEKLRDSTGELIVFRDSRRPPESRDIAYKLTGGNELVAIVDGHNVLRFKAGLVVIDTSDGSVTQVTLQGEHDSIVPSPVSGPAGGVSATLPEATVVSPNTVKTTQAAPLQTRPASAYLSDRSVFDPTDELNYSSGLANVNGEVYPNSVLLYSYSQGAGPVHVAFVLGRRYQRLRATVGIDDKATSGHSLRMQVIVDGVIVFQKDMLKGETAVLDADIADAYEAKFVATKLTPDSTVNDGYGVFGDAQVMS